MIKITQDQAFQRWDTLPLNIREALASDISSDFVWKTCETEHIPDQKIYDVARIAGYVFMGFLHPEDMAEELGGTLGIDQKTASSIAGAINQRIFAPVRQDIDKVYEPIGTLNNGPAIIQEVKPPQPPQPTGVSPKIISQIGETGLTIGMTPLGANKNPAPAPASNLSDKGWSKLTPTEPVLKFGTIKPMAPTPPSPATPVAPAFSVPKPAIPNPPSTVPKVMPQSMGEFEKMKMAQPPKPSAPPTAPSATGVRTSMPAAPSISQASPATQTAMMNAPKPDVAQEQKPFMLHENAMPAGQKSQDFKLDLGPKNPMAGKVTKSQFPTRPAVLELGNAPTPSPMQKSSTQGENVHFGEYKPAAAPVNPPAPSVSGPRNITEITAQNISTVSKPIPAAAAPIPRPPTPPQNTGVVATPQQATKSVPVPTPPMQQPPSGKPIVKNFLDPGKK